MLIKFTCAIKAALHQYPTFHLKKWNIDIYIQTYMCLIAHN